MSLQVEDLALPGLRLVTPKRFGDNRGFFSETYAARAFAAAGIDAVFVQDNHSRSAECGTVRGLHFQAPPYAQDKLIRVVRGRVLDVALDIRKGSPTYGKHVAVELSADNWAQLFVPVGFVHGFCTLVPDTEVVYKVTGYYTPQAEMGISWNDPDLGIAWPDFAGAQVSHKDSALPLWRDLKSPFIFES
jgi:dTDP-4-dehydrorhamnose 3,5-epimerase